MEDKRAIIEKKHANVEQKRANVEQKRAIIEEIQSIKTKFDALVKTDRFPNLGGSYEYRALVLGKYKLLNVLKNNADLLDAYPKESLLHIKEELESQHQAFVSRYEAYLTQNILRPQVPFFKYALGYSAFILLPTFSILSALIYIHYVDNKSSLVFSPLIKFFLN